MTAQFVRGSYPPRPAAQPHEPHAALLIDFDNVTMGIRSDLTKELKTLLNSDIIKGKVAVQRAYADWRRYPQYIVPLAEASVDLIFAPAYGSSKKNATDIRLAIDALELVFTRSEIGTFILLSGDSDFSSLVLKLKEYGKYVIGVGIRESASDLLVQNCDEYYSYSVLTGLTRTSDQAVTAGHDPWELVEQAVRQMVADGDVMRSDRLKQVILELDPNFDEKQLGFSKFNRFVQEAANRGLVRLHKMENGQFEIALADGEPVEAAPRLATDRDGRRGRGRRGRGRREEAQPRGAVADESEAATAEAAPPVQPKARSEPQPAAEPATPAQPQAAAPPAERPDAEQQDAGAEAGLEFAYDLLRRAAAEVAGSGVARDSDVKRRMLELRKDWDEAAYGFSKFSRFLRQAHDANVIDLRRLDNGNYEVAVRTDAGRSMDEAPARGLAEKRPPRGGRRDRREPAGPPKAAEPDAGAQPGVRESASEKRVAPALSEETRAQVEESAVAEVRVPAAMRPPKVSKPQTAASAQPASAPEAAPPEKPAAARTLGVGVRRGAQGRPQVAAPPPLLPGQTVGKKPSAAAQPATQSSGAQRESAQPDGAKPAVKPPPEDGRARKPRRGRKSEPAAVDATTLGLPAAPDAVIEYLSNNYKGVGRKTGEQLVEAFGAARVFQALDAQPERVRELLGARRAETLLEAWRHDRTRRAADAPTAPKDVASAETTNAASEEAGAMARKRRSRGRRGGRKRAATPS